LEKYQPICPEARLGDLQRLVERQASNPDVINETITKWWDDENARSSRAGSGAGVKGRSNSEGKKKEEEWTTNTKKKKPVPQKAAPMRGGPRAAGAQGGARGGQRGEMRGRDGAGSRGGNAGGAATRGGPNTGRVPAGE